VGSSDYGSLAQRCLCLPAHSSATATSKEFEDAAAASASVTDQPVTKQDSVDPWAEFRIAPKPVTDPALIKRLERMPNPWASLGRAATIAFGIPLVVLVVGASLVWAFAGFAAKRS